MSPFKLLGNFFCLFFIPRNFQSPAFLHKNFCYQSYGTCEAKMIKYSMYFNALISLTNDSLGFSVFQNKLFLIGIGLRIFRFVTVLFTNCLVNLWTMYYPLYSLLILNWNTFFFWSTRKTMVPYSKFEFSFAENQFGFFDEFHKFLLIFKAGDIIINVKIV